MHPGRRNPPTTRWASAVIGAACLLSAAPPARGQTPQQAGIEPLSIDLRGTERAFALIGAALSLLPGSLGADVSLTPPRADSTRFILAWPFQIPLRPGRFRTRTATFTNHRLLLEAAMPIGPQRGLVETETAWVTFEPRFGYRFVLHPSGGTFGFFLGLSHAMQFWPVVRPSISPELGLHIGVCCGEPALVFTLTLRADVYVIGNDPLRLGLLAGWAFY